LHPGPVRAPAQKPTQPEQHQLHQVLPFKALRRQIIGKLNHSHRALSATPEDALPDFQVTFSCETDPGGSRIGPPAAGKPDPGPQLPAARQKEAVFLRFYDNLSYEQVAAIMGIDTHSAYKTIYKAIAALQKKVAWELIVALLLVKLPHWQ
jgi:RNA polymerase sigma-70 factor (ECF subfamily)